MLRHFIQIRAVQATVKLGVSGELLVHHRVGVWRGGEGRVIVQ